MKERPILFSGPMVRAILSGTKTQTRRVINPQFRSLWGSGCPNDSQFFAKHYGQRWKDAFAANVDIENENGTWRWLFCPFGKPGDRLWVREIFGEGGMIRPGDKVSYAADWGEDAKVIRRWKPSIFMPREFSRLSLEITSVRVERLQEISEADAEAEGLCLFPAGCCERCNGAGRNHTWPRGCPDCGGSKHFARGRFHSGWNALNAKRGYGWDKNPWVWVVEFQRLAA